MNKNLINWHFARSASRLFYGDRRLPVTAWGWMVSRTRTVWQREGVG